jgi:phosphoribosylglycinamide formyltransferase-1
VASSSQADDASRLPIAVLLSGEGSNFGAIAAAANAGSLPVDIRLALSDRPAARGLERARALGIRAEALAPGDFRDRTAHDLAMQGRIDAVGARLVVLAGYMRIFDPGFIGHYAGRLLNIHPSLLPAYRGLHTHRRALADGAKWHGCTVHFVTDELDGGPLIAQARVPVRAGDDELRLASRVHTREHELYPQVIGWFARGRLRETNGRAWLDGQPLDAPLVLEDRDD